MLRTRETYIEQILAPSLRKGQIVILDNLSIHLGPRVKRAIEERSCQLLFLPAYSPDFSRNAREPFPNGKPSCDAWACERGVALQDAIIEELPAITPADALGWFWHCGYPSPGIDDSRRKDPKPERQA
jgi:hypothetical protein